MWKPDWHVSPIDQRQPPHDTSWMYGVGETLPGLSDFIGCTLVAISDLENIVYFRFSTLAHGTLEIGVQSEWVIRDPSGVIVAHGDPRPTTPVRQPPLGSVVVAAETRPPNAILLVLESAHTIEILDNSDQYESFCIPHAGVCI